MGLDAGRWERIKELFQAALDRPTADRSAFLRDVCGDDLELLAEIESLLDAHASAGSFAARPAVDVLRRPAQFEGESAGEIATLSTAFAPGERLGAYKVLSRLGSGGMGDVYRALDSTLGREVAIKVLPAMFTTDPDRLARFEREARVLAALNHPHIGAIYGLEHVGGSRALVLELIEGPTLAERLARGPLPIKSALSIALQIAEALEVAHERGIVHRDLKPANIKVTPNGVVKILDFGLAKTLVGDSAGLSGPVEPTREGAMLGTATYMSPEQARGLAVDRRTDIWAFGCVLYEMLTARTAFDADTIADTIAAIIERDPDWRRLPAATPNSIRQLLRRCLTKDPRHRLRDAADARFVVEDTLADVGVAPVVPIAAPGRSSHGYLAWGVALLAIVLGGAGWWAAYQRARPPDPFGDNPLANAQFTRFTDFAGSEQDAAISPDGKFVVFVSDRDGPFDVFLSQVGTGVFTNLTRGSESAMELIVRHVGISHDGSEIWLAGRYPDRRLRVMPLVGGTPKVFLDGNVVNVAWSPDGALITYHTGNPGDPLFVADHTGANARQIFINRIPGGHNHFPTWSPDGEWIYFVSGILATRDMDLWRIAPSGGEPQRLTSHHNDVGYPTAIDAHTLLYLSPADDGSGPWVWALDVEHRAARRVSLGLEKYVSLASSADGRRLVATVANPTANLWSVPIQDREVDERDVKPVVMPTVRALAPRYGSGGLFYLSSLGGGDGLWRYQDDRVLEIWKGTERALFEPAAVSPSDKRVAIALRRAGKSRLEVMSEDGTGLRPLNDVIDVRGSASWSPDGKWIATGGSDATGPGLFKVPIDGGEPVRLAAIPGLDPVWSPSGNVIVYAGPIVAAESPLLAVTPDGAPVELPPIRLRGQGERCRFLPDGKALVVMQGEWPSQDFWLLDLASKTWKRLTRLMNMGVMRTFDVTPDGKQIVFDRLRENGDIVLIDRKP